jgi:serine/threonine protein kinase
MASSSTWAFAQGDPIAEGRFALRKLGGGNRHEAYLAWDERLFTTVVVKIVRPHRVGDVAVRADLAREHEMLRRLDHPVIVRSFGGDVDGARPHLVLEHLEGPRLSTLLRKHGTLGWEQLIPLALQLCSALHYLGVEGIVHLDVKPSNVIMGPVARLIDLSVAHTVTDARNIRYPIGTDAYMSPEQCRPGSADPLTTASDIWGLGATLYEAVAGRRAFNGNHRAAGAERWPQLEVPAPPIGDRVPEDLSEPIARCLERAPRARPTPVELAGRLEPLLAALPRKPRLSRLRPRIR